jgi:Zn-dependent peptidase ImmA (M78 family)
MINASHPLALQRYSAGHEVGHHVFEHGAQMVREAEPQRDARELSDQEMIAEAFAAWFLMSPEGVAQTLVSMGLTAPASPRDVYALALRLGTSYRAACVHLPSLKLVSGARSMDWSKLSLKAIKQQLSAEPPPGGWRNDIWLLSRQDSERRVVARCGDRLLLEPEGCEVQALPPGASTKIVPPHDMLSTARLAIDLPLTIDAGPSSIIVRHDDALVEYPLTVERPRTGLYVPARGVPA